MKEARFFLAKIFADLQEKILLKQWNNKKHKKKNINMKLFEIRKEFKNKFASQDIEIEDVDWRNDGAFYNVKNVIIESS